MAQDQGVGPTGPMQRTSPDRADQGGRGHVGGLQRLRGSIAGLISRLKRLRGPIVAVAAVGTVLSGLLGIWNVYRTFHDSVDVLPAPAVPEPPLFSIAVMPFTPATASPEDAAFAERLTQDLTSAVQRSGWAHVTSH